MILLEDVTVTFGDKEVLNHLDLKLPKKGITALSGASGCGKTTLLRVIAGLQPVDGGRVLGITPAEVAMQFQENRLLPWRTVTQQLTDVLPRERWCEVPRYLQLADLEGEGDNLPAQLSGGMARRLSLVRTLALGRPMLVLDEPFTGVDAVRMTAMMEAIRETGTPVLLATHEKNVLDSADLVINFG